jgi:hypothetical protein
MKTLFMPRLLPFSAPVTLDQILQRNSYYTDVDMTAEEMLTKINLANSNLAKLNLDRGTLHIPEQDEARIIAAAQQSLAFLQRYTMCFQTQNSLGRQLGIYFGYHKNDGKNASVNFLSFMHNNKLDSLGDAQGFMYSGYTNLLNSKSNDDSMLTKAQDQMNRLSQEHRLDNPAENNELLADLGHVCFLLALTHYRKNELAPLAESGKWLETAGLFLLKAINYQTEALTLAETDDAQLPMLLELTNSWRLACVISYKTQDIFDKDKTFEKSQEWFLKMTLIHNRVKETSPHVRVALIQDKFVAEFFNIQTAIQLRTGSTPTIAGMYGAVRQATSHAALQTQSPAAPQHDYRPPFG